MLSDAVFAVKWALWQARRSHAAAASIRNRYFRESLERSKALLYAA